MPITTRMRMAILLQVSGIGCEGDYKRNGPALQFRSARWYMMKVERGLLMPVTE